MPNRNKYKNFYLLILLISYFICNAILASHEMNTYLVSAGIAFTILISVNLIMNTKTISLISIPFAFFIVCSYLMLYTQDPSAKLYTFHFAFNGLFLVLVTFIEIRTVASQQEITLNTLLGAICGYLLIGLTWSYFYIAISHADNQAFYPLPPDHSFRITLDYFMYFSYSTLTTLGYGDIVPKSNFARTLAWMEAALGQVYMAVWISQLVATHIAQRIRGQQAPH